MSFHLYLYRRVSDLEKALQHLERSRGRVFLVGGSGDRELLKQVLSGTGNSPDYQILRWDELYRFFAERLRSTGVKVQLDPPDHWLLLHGIVEDYRRERGDDALPPGALRRGFLDILGREIRELIREEVTPSMLENSFPSGEDSLWDSFVSLYQKYLNALGDKLSDSAGVTSETRKILEAWLEEQAQKDSPGQLFTSSGGHPLRCELVLVGFSSLTHSQLELIRAVTRTGEASVRLYAPLAEGREGDGKKFYGAREQFFSNEELADLSRSWNVSILPSADRAPFRVMKLEGGDPRQELETAARSLALWEQGQGPLPETFGPFRSWDDVGFLIPAGRVAEAREVFHRYGLPCRWNFRVPVSETPLWELSRSCIEADSAGWQTEPVLRLLSLPWLCGLDVNASVWRSAHPRGKQGWRDFFRKDGEAVSQELKQLFGKRPDQQALERELARRKKALKAFDSCCAYAEGFRKERSVLEILVSLQTFAAGRAISVAEFVKDEPPLDDGIALFAGAVKELERKILFVREVVRDLGRYGDRTLKDADARAFLSAWAEGTSVSAMHNEANCISLFNAPPSALFSVPFFFLAGAEASQWPGGQKESPLFSENRKEELHRQGSGLGLCANHLPLLTEKRQQKEFLFRRLIACGERCTVLCHSASDSQNRPQEATLLLESARSDGWCSVDGNSIVRGLGDLLLADEEPRVAPVEVRKPDLTVENTLPKQRLFERSFDALKDRVPLSAVQDFVDCPYKFALSHVLGYEEPVRELEYNALWGGTVIHSLWEEVWKAHRDRGFNGSLEALCDSLFEDVIRRSDYADLCTSQSLFRHKVNLRRQVLRSARMQDRWESVIAPKREKVFLECPLPVLTRRGVTFSGKCDRLDVLKDGTFLLWDYKSGASENYKSSFQLACYAVALEKGERGGSVPEDLPVFAEGACQGWGYISLKDGKVGGLWSGVWNKEGRQDKKDLLSRSSPKKLNLELPVAAADGAVQYQDCTREELSPDQMKADAEVILDGMALLLMQGGDLRRRYGNGKDKTCTYCAYQSLCRRGELTNLDENDEDSDEDTDGGEE